MGNLLILYTKWPHELSPKSIWTFNNDPLEPQFNNGHEDLNDKLWSSSEETHSLVA